MSLGKICIQVSLNSRMVQGNLMDRKDPFQEGIHLQQGCINNRMVKMEVQLKGIPGMYNASSVQVII